MARNTLPLSISRVLMHNDPMTHRVVGIADLIDWKSGANRTCKLEAGHGEHITNPWFAILSTSDDPNADEDDGTAINQFRRQIRLTTSRFMFKPFRPRPTDPMAALGTWSQSWYLVNDGPDFNQPVRIEVGFVATQMHGHAEMMNNHLDV